MLSRRVEFVMTRVFPTTEELRVVDPMAAVVDPESVTEAGKVRLMLARLTLLSKVICH